MNIAVQLLAVILSVGVTHGKISYKGHRVYDVTVASTEVAQQLTLLRVEGTFDVDFWGDPVVGGNVPIHVTPESEPGLLKLLRFSGIAYKLKVDDIQKLIDEEEQANLAATTLAGSSIVGTYVKTEQIHKFMDKLALLSPIANVIHIGKSYEGRDLKLLKLSSDGETKKPSVFIDAGIHAREWIAPATLVWIMEHMTMNYYNTENNLVAWMVSNFDWYLLPVLNPDGYDYTFDEDRLWRKTRSRHGKNICHGVDGNRNFDYPVFGGASTSSSSCSDLYKGPAAFSEPETAALRDFMLHNASNVELYIALHSYSQLWLTPWGYGPGRPEDAHELDEAANIGAAAIQEVNGLSFTVGTAPDILYAAGGGAYDWVKGSAGVKYSYTLELRPDAADESFIIPDSNIKPSGEEIFAALYAVCNYINKAT